MTLTLTREMAMDPAEFARAHLAAMCRVNRVRRAGLKRDDAGRFAR